MYIKKVRQKCGVRGCKNTDCYSISKSREMGFSVIACESCFKEALKAVKELNAPEKREKETEEKPSVNKKRSDKK